MYFLVVAVHARHNCLPINVQFKVNGQTWNYRVSHQKIGLGRYPTNLHIIDVHLLSSIATSIWHLHPTVQLRSTTGLSPCNAVWARTQPPCWITLTSYSHPAKSRSPQWGTLLNHAHLIRAPCLITLTSQPPYRITLTSYRHPAESRSHHTGTLLNHAHLIQALCWITLTSYRHPA